MSGNHAGRNTVQHAIWLGSRNQPFWTTSTQGHYDCPSRLAQEERRGQQINSNKKVSILTTIVATIFGAGSGTVLFSAGAYAQQSAEQSSSIEMIEEVVVTATRLKTTAFESPTPLQVLGSKDIEVRGAANVADLISQMPGFSPTVTPSATRLSRGSQGATALDLRGIGSNRNLVLVNGRRTPAYNASGTVNVNLVPSLLVERVEVVTGGASAAWGSDAIAGVINIIYDSDFDGAKLELQGGSSGENDAQNYKIGIAYGSDFDNGDGHFVFAMEHYENRGITDIGPRRDWESVYPGLIPNPADTGPNDGIPRLLIATDVRARLAAVGGVTVDQPDPINNLQFLPDGTARPRLLGFGAEARGPTMMGGEGTRYIDGVDLVVPLERDDFIAIVERKLTDSVALTVEGNYDRTFSNTIGATYGDERNTIQINSGNPYLPAGVQGAMTANGIESFQLARSFEDAPRIGLRTTIETLRVLGALKGAVADRWQWELYYQWARGRSTHNNYNNFNRENLNKAADAIMDPATGEIVCASTFSGADTDCVPVNLFGEGNLDPEAMAYIQGDNWQDLTNIQKVIAANIGGDVLEGWAGPISAVIGAEYREEDIDQIVDLVSAEGDWRTGNATALKGNLDVVDIFAESIIPIISGEHEFAVNTAVRWTNNSNSSGGLYTWKGGMTFRPISSVLLRGTASKDARSPTIGETFLDSSDSQFTISNPFTGNIDTGRQFLTGNPFLVEETADNLTFGVVFNPDVFDIQVSVDWFNIDLHDAIESIGPQGVVDQCFAGDANFCRFITFLPDETIRFIDVGLVNLGLLTVEGVDFAAHFGANLWGGNLTADLVATQFIEKSFGLPGDPLKDVAGQMGWEDSRLGVPDYVGQFTVDYQRNQLGLNGRLRFISDGKHDNAWTIEDLAPEQNRIDGVAYLDLSARYQFDQIGGTQLRVYAGINNALDEDPPVVGLLSIFTRHTNPQWFDVIGRQYYVGARLSF